MTQDNLNTGLEISVLQGLTFMLSRSVTEHQDSIYDNPKLLSISVYQALNQTAELHYCSHNASYWSSGHATSFQHNNWCHHWIICPLHADMGAPCTHAYIFAFLLTSHSKIRSMMIQIKANLSIYSNCAHSTHQERKYQDTVWPFSYVYLSISEDWVGSATWHSVTIILVWFHSDFIWSQILDMRT